MWRLDAVGLTGLVVVVLCGCSSKEADAEPACGGDLVGAWEAPSTAVPPHPLMNIDACWNLMLGVGADGALSASSRYRLPNFREGMAMFNRDGTFAMGLSARGDVTLSYGASCLETVTPKPTCDQLAPPLAISGLGEGSVRSVTCSQNGGGGCDCTFAVWETGGYSGTWSTSGSWLQLTPVRGQMSEPSIEGTYCVKGETLRLASDFDELSYALSRLTFAVQTDNCSDGKQSGSEQGIDCGGNCAILCP